MRRADDMHRGRVEAMAGEWLDRSAMHPFAGFDVAALLALRASTRGTHPFLLWEPFDGERDTWTYERFAREVSSLAAGLAARGIRKGDRVVVHLDNCPEFLLAYFACAQVGAVAVTTNTRSAEDELEYFAGDCGAVAVVTQPRYAELVSRSAKDARWIAVTDNDSGVPVSPGSAPERASSFASLLGDPDAAPVRPADPLDLMMVQYTSGSTARPKGVVYTHANALWAARVNADHEALRPDDRHLVAGPLFHINAIGYCALPTLWTGASMVLVPKWSTSRFWDISLRHQCTWFSVIGYANAMVDREVPPGHSYRLWGSGLSDLPTDAKLGIKKIGWWGMTETVSHPIVGHPYLPGRPMAIGRPAPEYGIAVVDDDGEPVEPGQRGHLLVKGVRGLSLFKEYLNQPQATEDSFDDLGWFKTGDLVTPGADGYIDFAGRAKDMLKVGGENVAAMEIERVLGGVDDVVEVAVIPMAHPALGQVPVAYIVGDDDGTLAKRALEQCRTQLADFKVPRDIRVVPELPRLARGKIDKVELGRALSEDRLPLIRTGWDTPDS